MRRPRTALDRKRIRWEGITGNLGQHLEALPHFKGPYEALRAKVEESLELERQINTLQATLGESLARLDQIAMEGEEIRGRLTAALQAEYGFASKRLHEFGLQPRRSRGRRKKASPPETTDPAAPPADSAE